jgi:DNA-binding CsgD family transcriptional regulator
VILIGRTEECQAIDALLASVREGFSGTLVVRGEPGIGKTALVDYAAAAAVDFLVVRFTGVEAESHIGFAALHRLLLPILHQIERLPAPQRDAMNSALGLATGPPANKFLVGLGTMSLAANAARARKRVLTIIDDAQWVDRESLETLAFWGRRLHADGIALIFGERSEAESADLLNDFPRLEVGRLDPAGARELLATARDDVLDRDVAERIIQETEGNPLALVEMAKRLTPDALVGAGAAPQPLPIGRRLEQQYLRQVRSLPADTQMLLLLAAADSSADVALLSRAASVLGVPLDAVGLAETADLLEAHPQIRYRHPLIRSAVYNGARAADRRAVHSALAATTDPDADPDRRAWHLAAASVGPDQEIAALLERRAGLASSRGSHNAALALLTSAAELTGDRVKAANRQVLAAEAALATGSPRQARALATTARKGVADRYMRARAERAEGIAALREGELPIAACHLLVAGIGLGGDDLARDTLLQAVEVACFAGYSASHQFMTEIAHAVGSPRAAAQSVVEALLRAFATEAREGYVAAVPMYRSAVETMTNDTSPTQLAPWVSLVSTVTLAVWDNHGHAELLRRIARASRDAGLLTPLGTALTYGAYDEMWAGQLADAEAMFAEGTDAYVAAGEHLLPQMDLQLDALRGRDTDLLAKADFAIGIGDSMGIGAYANAAHEALASLALARGQYRSALEHSRVVFDSDSIQFGPHVLSDMVEAAVRVGDSVARQAALHRLCARTTAAETPWSRGLRARSRALVVGDDGEELYNEAIDFLGAASMPIELARARLLYGEWLRRQKRRLDAREQLRAAHAQFASMGVVAFAERARDELLATGERARKRTVDTSTDLTAQERHVARLAADGATNGEIASQLFISTSTVEYHLRKVFRKLSVTSRRELKRALPL